MAGGAGAFQRADILFVEPNGRRNQPRHTLTIHRMARQSNNKFGWQEMRTTPKSNVAPLAGPRVVCKPAALPPDTGGSRSGWTTTFGTGSHQQVDGAGGGIYRTLINEALRRFYRAAAGIAGSGSGTRRPPRQSGRGSDAAPPRPSHWKSDGPFSDVPPIDMCYTCF